MSAGCPSRRGLPLVWLRRPPSVATVSLPAPIGRGSRGWRRTACSYVAAFAPAGAFAGGHLVAASALCALEGAQRC
eukprot:13182991-Alexandrium_andersonii.AAC.1